MKAKIYLCSKGGPTLRSKPETPNFLVDIVKTKANYENEFVKGGHSLAEILRAKGKIVSHHNAHVFLIPMHFKGGRHLYSIEFFGRTVGFDV